MEKIIVTEERQRILDEECINYQIYEDENNFIFSFKCPKEKDKAIAVLSAALEI